MNKKILSFLPEKMPLFGVLVVPFVLLIILITGLVGILSYINGQEAVNFVAYELRENIGLRISEHLTGILKIPHQITNDNKYEILQSHLNLTDLEDYQIHFLEIVKTFPTISSTYFGSVDGGIVGSGREGTQDLFYVYYTDNLLPGKFSKLAVDEMGNPQDLLSSVERYDARTRPWYIAAIEKGDATWSNIYILTTGQDMAIAASRPIYDSSNNLVGVTSVDLFLSQIGRFLQELTISPNGKSFIIEKDGNLIATSTDEKPFRINPESGKLERISADQSQTPIIRSAVAYLVKKFGSVAELPSENLDLMFLENGQQYFLRVQPLNDQYGINWLIIVVIPENDFMAQINANNRSTGVIVLSALVITLILSVITGGSIAHRIHNISKASEALAKGKWNEALAPNSRIIEFDLLSRSYNQMAVQLHGLLTNLTQEIEERKMIENSLRESKERYRSLVENIPIGVFRTSPEGAILAANPALIKLFRIQPEETYVHFSLSSFFVNPNDYADFQHQLIHPHHHISQEFQLINNDGEKFWARITAHAINSNHHDNHQEQQPILFLDGVLEDITERRTAVLFTQKSLKEKEVLLQELYHRTKNNMQVINALLMMQAQDINDNRIAWVFKNMENRIYAMSLVHEKLYESHDLSRLNFKDYANDLIHQLFASYHRPDQEITLDLAIDDLQISLDVAIPCGLILNELITNSLKYAFPGDFKNATLKIQIEKNTEGIIEIIVADNGVGIPDVHQTRLRQKMGLAIIYSIAEHQLRGSVSIENNNGVKWTIRFSDRQYEVSN